MEIFILRSLPVCKFGHTFSADRYHNVIAARANCLEISYVSDGVMGVTVDGKSYTAQRGDLVINDFLHDFCINTDEYHGHRTVCFKMEYSTVSRIPVVVTPRDNSSQIYHLIDEIIKTKSLEPDCAHKCTGLFLQLLGEIEYLLSESVEGGGEYLYVRRAKRYIHERLNLPIAQRELADYLGITPEYLCAVFKKVTGETVMKYVNRAKLEGIRSMMKRENLPLYRAAELFGFSDPNYVSRLYRKYYGTAITDEERFKYKPR